jgi:DNA primase
LRQEKEASFKVHKNKNVWYDHGIAKGGNLVDFVTEYYRCNVSEALQKFSPFHPQNFLKNIADRPPVHLHQNSVRNEQEAGETAIKIIAAKKPMTDLLLCSYLRNSSLIRPNFPLYSTLKISLN